jgi:hypothetical protein
LRRGDEKGNTLLASSKRERSMLSAQGDAGDAAAGQTQGRINN